MDIYNLITRSDLSINEKSVLLDMAITGKVDINKYTKLIFTSVLMFSAFTTTVLFSSLGMLPMINITPCILVSFVYLCHAIEQLDKPIVV